MNKSRIFLLFFLMGLCSTSVAGLEISISSQKSTFLLLEPVLVRYQVKNIGPDSIKFRKSAIPTSFIVTDSKNKKYHSNFSGSYLGLPPAFGPGESVEGAVDLNIYGKRVTKSSSTSALPIGKYKAYLEIKLYGVNKKAMSNTIELEVVEPSGKEKEAYRGILAADSLRMLKQKEASYKKMLEVYRNYPRSVYNQYAFVQALVKYPFDDKRERAELSREFIEKYPNSEYLDDVLFIIFSYYQSKKDKIGYEEGLKLLIEKYPGTEVSRKAKNRLETIDRLKF